MKVVLCFGVERRSRHSSVAMEMGKAVLQRLANIVGAKIKIHM